MFWSLAFATVMLTVPSLKFSKGAFVGAFNSEGQTMTVTAPSGENWISREQVQREVLFRGWKAPLTSAQMAEVAKGLEADFAVDILVSIVRARRNYRLVIMLRCVSAQFGAITYLSQEQASLSSLNELETVVDKISQILFAKIPKQIPFAIVQLREGERRVHLIAKEGEWKRKSKLLFFRDTGGHLTLLGEGQIVTTDLLIGGSRWLLEADLTEVKFDLRAGDKAIQVFKLPKEFAKLQ